MLSNFRYRIDAPMTPSAPAARTVEAHHSATCVESARWQTIGRPGLFGRARDRRRREFDHRFGLQNWRIRHVLQGQILELSEAVKHVESSYAAFFEAHSEVLDKLVGGAADFYENALSNLRSGTDYQIQERKTQHIFDIALRRVILESGRRFAGKQLVRIGGPRCKNTPLSPGRVPFERPERISQPILRGWWDSESVLSFWESNKVLQTKRGEDLTGRVGLNG